MRRPPSALAAAVLGTALAVPTVSAQQQTPSPPGDRPAVKRGAGASASAPSPIAALKPPPLTPDADASAPAGPAYPAGRTARHLLRNGWDYLGYEQYPRALDFFIEAESRQAELTSSERVKLKQGMERARQGVREARTNPKARPSYAIGRTPGAALTAQADPAAVRRLPGLDTRVPTPLQAATPPSSPAPAAVAVAVAEPTLTLTAAQPQPQAQAQEAAPAPAPAGSPEAPAAEPAPLALEPAPPLADDQVALTAGPEPAPAPEATEAALPTLVPQPAAAPEAAPSPAPAAAADESQEVLLPSADLAPSLAPEPTPAPEPAPTPAPAPEPAPEPSSTLPAGPVLARNPDPAPAEPAPALVAEAAEAPLPRPEPPAPEPAPAPVAEAPGGPQAPAPEQPQEAPAPAPEPSPAETPLAATQPTPEVESLPPLPAGIEPPPAAEAPGTPAPTAAGPEADADLPPLPTTSDTPPAPAPAAEATPGRGVFGRDTLVPDRRSPAPGESSLSPELQRAVERIARQQDNEMRRGREADTPQPGGDPGLGGPVTSGSTASTKLEITRAPSPTEARPLRAIPVPEEFVPLPKRDWDPNRKFWAAAATCHMPLYFQDAALERYGYTIEQHFGHAGRFLTYPIDDPRQSKQRNQLMQPFASIGLFLFQVGVLPYNLVMDPPWEAEYDLGYYRPGDRVPTDTFYLPLTGVGPPLQGAAYGKPNAGRPALPPSRW